MIKKIECNPLTAWYNFKEYSHILFVGEESDEAVNGLYDYIVCLGTIEQMKGAVKK